MYAYWRGTRFIPDGRDSDDRSSATDDMGYIALDVGLGTVEELGCEVTLLKLTRVEADIVARVVVGVALEGFIIDVEVNTAGSVKAVFIRHMESSPHVSPILQHT